MSDDIEKSQKRAKLLMGHFLQKDFAAAKALVEDGFDPNWKDQDGNTLLHYAAAHGDEALAAALVDRGAELHARNKNLDLPCDIARIFGYAATTAFLEERMKAATPPSMPPLSYASLQEIRAQSLASGVDEMNALIKTGRTLQLLELAEKDPQGLRAADLLARGSDGETALLKICRQGLLPQLFKQALWQKNADAAAGLWEAVPEDCRKGVDYAALTTRLHQSRLTLQPNRTKLRPK